MSLTITATPAITALPTQRAASHIRRPKHRKAIPDEHVTYLDDLLIRIGLGVSRGRHRVGGPVDVLVLPVVLIAGGAA